MLDHIADQVQADADVIALFARRDATRYEQLATIKARHGFRDLSHPLRVELTAWAQDEAVGLTDGRVLLERLIERMRAERIIIPGISVVERLTATAMHSADLAAIAEIGGLLSPPQCDQMDVLLSNKVHRQQSRLSWLRAPTGGVGARSLAEILDRLDLVRSIVGDVPARLPLYLNHCMAQMVREGSLYTAQAFQQMNAPRRHAIMIATLSEQAITLTDAALSMFQSLVGRANLRAKKRLEETIAASAEQGRFRLLRIAQVLEAVVTTMRADADVAAAVTAIALLETIADDAAIIRRTLRPGRPDVLGELAPEYHVFKKIGARFLSSFAFEGRRAVQPLLAVIAVLGGIGDRRNRYLPTFRSAILSGADPDMSLPTIPLTAPIPNWPPTSSWPMRLRTEACGLRHREFTARSKSASHPLRRQLRRNQSLWFTLSMPKPILRTAWLCSMQLFRTRNVTCLVRMPRYSPMESSASQRSQEAKTSTNKRVPSRRGYTP
jgi:hypothetical protein